MRRQLLLTAVSCVVCLGLTSALEAAQIVRSSAGAVETIDCNGLNVAIKGMSNRYTLRGECPRVDVQGTTNKVLVETAGRIHVDGVGNEVVWAKALSGERPRIVNSGLNNTVRQGDVGARASGTASGGPSGGATARGEGAGAVLREAGEGSIAVDGSGRVVIRDEHTGDTVTAGAGKVVAREGRSGDTVSIQPERVSARQGKGADAKRVVINDSNVARRVRCEEGVSAVVVNGDDCNVTLEGACELLSVKGNDNRVNALGPIASIQLLGNDNLVTWSADQNPKAPQVESLGSDNVARPSSR